MKHKVIIECILASDAKAITQMQAKINTWMTTSLLVKYELHTTATHVVFNICMKKEA
jgi:hypothetical protein